jgi:tetratricopeptide (TPR) repeat protein
MALMCLVVFPEISNASSAEGLKHRGWLASMGMDKDQSALKKARELFLQARKLDPNDADIDYLIGFTYFKEGEFALIHEEDKEKARELYEKALASCEEGLEKDPENLECRFGRAACLARILDTKYSGKSMLNNVFSLGGIVPKLRMIEKDTQYVISKTQNMNPDIHESYDYTYFSMVMRASLDWFYPRIIGGGKEKAIGQLMEAAKRRLNDPLPYYTMARLYFEIDKDYAKAKEYCVKVLEWERPYYFFDDYAFYRPHCERILRTIQTKTASVKPQIPASAAFNSNR